MSDERVVWDAPIGQVRADGKFRRHQGVTWDPMTQAGLIEDLARALAESEAKRAKLDAALRTIARWDVSGIQREGMHPDEVLTERGYFRQLALDALLDEEDVP